MLRLLQSSSCHLLCGGTVLAARAPFRGGVRARLPTSALSAAETAGIEDTWPLFALVRAAGGVDARLGVGTLSAAETATMGDTWPLLC